MSKIFTDESGAKWKTTGDKTDDGGSVIEPVPEKPTTINKYSFKVETSNLDYVDVEAVTQEDARQIAMDMGMALHPRKEDKSGPQRLSAECLYDSEIANKKPRCKINGCNKPILGEGTGGYCGLHY